MTVPEEKTILITIGVLALQGAFREHLQLLRSASDQLESSSSLTHSNPQFTFNFIEVRTPSDLSQCSALIIPGGESTAISLVASRNGLLEPLRDFVRVQKRLTWGTCAGLILLSESANRTKKGGQELIGGLDVRVTRNHFGRQTESFIEHVELSFLADTSEIDGTSETKPGGEGGASDSISDPKEEEDRGKGREELFKAIFIRAPIVEEVLSLSSHHHHHHRDEPTQEQRQNSSGGNEHEQEHVTAPPAPALVTKHSNNGSMGESRSGSESRIEALKEEVQIMARLGGPCNQDSKSSRRSSSNKEPSGSEGEIVAVKQGNVFGTSFHPELSGDARIHRWWLGQVLELMRESESGSMSDEG